MNIYFIIVGIILVLIGVCLPTNKNKSESSDLKPKDVNEWNTNGQLWVEPNNEDQPLVIFTSQEWENLIKDDAVYNFMKQVNQAALEKDYWSKDFRRATYDAFHEELNKYLCKKYNNGGQISIIETDFRHNHNVEDIR